MWCQDIQALFSINSVTEKKLKTHNIQQPRKQPMEEREEKRTGESSGRNKDSKRGGGEEMGRDGR